MKDPIGLFGRVRATRGVGDCVQGGTQRRHEVASTRWAGGWWREWGVIQSGIYVKT